MQNGNTSPEEIAEDNEQRHIATSPNISTNTTSGEVLEEIGVDEPKVEVSVDESKVKIDHIPFKEEEIKFRSENIKRTTGKDLMTNVEGAERCREQERHAHEKQIKEAEEARKKTEKEKAQQAKKHQRTAKRKERHAKVVATVNKVKRLKFGVLAVVAIAALAFVMVKYIVPIVGSEIEKQRIAADRAQKDKYFEDNLTAVMKIYLKVAERELAIDELEKEIKDIDDNAQIEKHDGYGQIFLNGTTEIIYFDTEKVDSGEIVSKNYNYKDVTGGVVEQIYKAGDIYLYSGMEEVKEFDNLKDALLEHQKLRESNPESENRSQGDD